ncbi:MAG TPA: LysE family translocator [Bauldia sp.]|nr:LysE family translocator [Bauldia sp.]
MEYFLALLTFVVVATCTPGPNNFMVLASGANWGLARTIPHILGIAIGFPVMIVAVGFGLDAAFEAFPALYDVLKWVAFAYLLYLAWRVANAGRPKLEEEGGRPLSLLAAAAFQWVNPKAWAIIISAVALYTSPDGNQLLEVALIALLFGLVCIPNGIVWALFGTAIARFLENDRHRRIFNIVMAVLLVASVAPTLFE